MSGTEIDLVDRLEKIVQQCTNDAHSQNYKILIFTSQKLVSGVAERDAADTGAGSSLPDGLFLDLFVNRPALDDGSPCTRFFLIQKLVTTV